MPLHAPPLIVGVGVLHAFVGVPQAFEVRPPASLECPIGNDFPPHASEVPQLFAYVRVLGIDVLIAARAMPPTLVVLLPS